MSISIYNVLGLVFSLVAIFISVLIIKAARKHLREMKDQERALTILQNSYNEAVERGRRERLAERLSNVIGTSPKLSPRYQELVDRIQAGEELSGEEVLKIIDPPAWERSVKRGKSA